MPACMDLVSLSKQALRMCNQATHNIRCACKQFDAHLPVARTVVKELQAGLLKLLAHSGCKGEHAAGFFSNIAVSFACALLRDTVDL